MVLARRRVGAAASSPSASWWLVWRSGLFFDQAFQTFHEIFLRGGTYMFRSDGRKLVQLFPDQFWSETSIAISVAIPDPGNRTTVIAPRAGPRT